MPSEETEAFVRVNQRIIPSLRKLAGQQYGGRNSHGVPGILGAGGLERVGAVRADGPQNEGVDGEAEEPAYKDATLRRAARHMAVSGVCVRDLDFHFPLVKERMNNDPSLDVSPSVGDGLEAGLVGHLIECLFEVNCHVVDWSSSPRSMSSQVLMRRWSIPTPFVPPY